MSRLLRVETSRPPVTAEQVPALLVEAIPSLSDEWIDMSVANAEPSAPGGRLGYLDAARVVRHLAGRLDAGDTADFDAAFDFIERLILEGDEYVSELGVIGYLEGLQMQTVTSQGVDPETFRPWLRPVSAKYWEALSKS
jgi:hypothetical protein